MEDADSDTSIERFEVSGMRSRFQQDLNVEEVARSKSSDLLLKPDEFTDRYGSHLFNVEDEDRIKYEFTEQTSGKDKLDFKYCLDYRGFLLASCEG